MDKEVPTLEEFQRIMDEAAETCGKRELERFWRMFFEELARPPDSASECHSGIGPGPHARCKNYPHCNCGHYPSADEGRK